MATKTKRATRPAGPPAESPELAAPTRVTTQSYAMARVKLEDLSPNPYQPPSRVNIDEATAERFAVSIRENGLMQVPLVRKAGANGSYQVADGWLRRAGFQYLRDHGSPEFGDMPVHVLNLSDEQMLDCVLEANLVRQDLNPVEQAQLYRRALDELKITQRELGQRHNLSQPQIANTLRLLELPEKVQAKLISREITEGHARQLLRLKDPETMNDVLAEALEEDFSVRELEQTVNDAILENSRTLDTKRYNGAVFDVKACAKCEHRTVMSRWGGGDKEAFCLNPECWEEKQKAAQAEQKEANAEKIAAGGILTEKDLLHGQYNGLGDWDLKQLDTPTQCRVCDKRRQAQLYGAKEPELICVDMKCFNAKKAAKLKADRADGAAKSEALFERLEKAAGARPVQVLKFACAVLGERPEPAVRKRFIDGHEGGDDVMALCDRLARLVLAGLIGQDYNSKAWTMPENFGNLRALAILEQDEAAYLEKIEPYQSKQCRGCALADTAGFGALDRDPCREFARLMSGRDEKCWRRRDAKEKAPPAAERDPGVGAGEEGEEE